MSCFELRKSHQVGSCRDMEWMLWKAQEQKKAGYVK
jgi:hypothetical protein